MKKIYMLLAAIVTMAGTGGCDQFFDKEADGIIPYEDVFADDNTIRAAIANLYGRVHWGMTTDNDEAYKYYDEACNSNGNPQTFNGFDDAFMRVYEYGLIRNINQFLEGLRSSAAAHIDEVIRNNYEGEVRFLRAWTYFAMCRSMGGMPIVGDQVFDYQSGMDITALQYPRATEAAMYDYIIAECEDIARNFLLDNPTKNSARVNKWAALTLKARAALFAGSIAKYNNLLTPDVKTDGGEVGIPASLADGYYDTALKAAKEVIISGKYELYQESVTKSRGLNFYEALAVKTNNKEVIWTFDRIYPGSVTAFSYRNVPTSAAEDEESTRITPILNLVEAFEYKTDRDGKLKIRDNANNYIFYDKASDLFADKDPRLWGTVIYPGAEFKDQEILFQAGRKYLSGGVWTNEVGPSGSKDGDGEIITSINGPLNTNDNYRNKTGFCIRKFLDTKKQSSTRQGSDMWFVRFRYAEVLLIAAEAAMEINDPAALGYINEVRDRAGIQPLTAVTLNDIVRERRVELAYEDHRFWDMKRWRLAHTTWTGVAADESASHYALFPFKINEPGDPNDGKWVFDKIKTHMTMYPIKFEKRNYYNFIDQDWRNKNPKMVKNPFQ